MSVSGKRESECQLRALKIAFDELVNRLPSIAITDRHSKLDRLPSVSSVAE